MRQRVADLAYGLLLPSFIIVFAIVIFPMLWNLLLAFRPIRLRDLPENACDVDDGGRGSN